MRAVARLADAVRGRGQPVVRNPLHVIAGVDDDRAARRASAAPICRCGDSTPAARRSALAGRIVNRSTSSWPSSRPAPERSCSVGHRRIIIEPQAEVGLGQLVVEQVRVAAQALEHRLRDRLEQRSCARTSWRNCRSYSGSRPDNPPAGTAPSRSCGMSKARRHHTQPSTRSGWMSLVSSIGK